MLGFWASLTGLQRAGLSRPLSRVWVREAVNTGPGSGDALALDQLASSQSAMSPAALRELDSTSVWTLGVLLFDELLEEFLVSVAPRQSRVLNEWTAACLRTLCTAVDRAPHPDHLRPVHPKSPGLAGGFGKG